MRKNKKYKSYGFAITLFALIACSGIGNKRADYAFGYDSRGDNEGVEIIDYQYGDVDHASSQDVDSHHIGQSGYIYGNYPMGEFLYVKWKDNNTELISEETVDLRGKLPSQMDGKKLHFLIGDKKLKIYVISKKLHEKNEMPCPVSTYDAFHCELIYPGN